jgi:hypothetical protein
VILSHFVFCFLIFMASSFHSFSQKEWQRAYYGSPMGGMKAQLDTLYNGFENYTPTLFEGPTGGFMNGTNGYGDQAKAQLFFADSSYKVLGAVYWFGYKKRTQPAGQSQVILRMYRRDAIQPVNGVAAPVPGSWHEQKILSLDDVPAGSDLSQSALVWILDTARYVSGAYYFGFDMDLMHPLDTIALFSSDSGQILRSNMSWEKWQGLWNTIENNWGLPVDFAIFPIVDLENAGIASAIPGIILHLEGNPVTTGTTLVITTPYPVELRLDWLTHEGRVVAEETLHVPAGGLRYTPKFVLQEKRGAFLLLVRDNRNRGVVFRALKP